MSTDQSATKPRTIIEKVWDSHIVAERKGAPTLIYIDLHLVHEVTSPQAFSGLRERGLKVRRPDLTFGTTDHSIPTHDRNLPIIDKVAEAQITQFEKNCRDFGIPFYGPHSRKQGIVHVIGPEQGLTQPGMTVVCGDSHTATHGAFGALAFGIGTSQVEHVLATNACCRAGPRRTRCESTACSSQALERKTLFSISSPASASAAEPVVFSNIRVRLYGRCRWKSA